MLWQQTPSREHLMIVEAWGHNDDYYGFFVFTEQQLFTLQRHAYNHRGISVLLPLCLQSFNRSVGWHPQGVAWVRPLLPAKAGDMLLAPLLGRCPPIGGEVVMYERSLHQTLFAMYVGALKELAAWFYGKWCNCQRPILGVHKNSLQRI